MLRVMSNAQQLRLLGEEPFGSRLRRAREASGIELRAAAEIISRVMFTSHTRLNRLEKMIGPPPDRERRALAYLAMLVYEFDPAQLGLSKDDLPQRLSENVELGAWLRSRCNSGLSSAWDLAMAIPA